MTTMVGGMPLYEISLDEQGDIDPAGESALLAALAQQGTTDLIVFSHGWNNSVSTANRLYTAFFGKVADQLTAHGAPDRVVTFLGVHWPSQLWSDEPIPDFEGSAPDLSAGAGGGGAAFGAQKTFPPPPAPDAASEKAMLAAFPPAQHAAVRELVQLLRDRPDDQASLSRARTLLKALAVAAGPGDDGERGATTSAVAGTDATDNELFQAFWQALTDEHVRPAAADGGAAGLGDALGSLWHGAQEVARQATYWQMKKRAGIVGEHGLGPMLARVLDAHPTLGVHLVGHSFGGRLVSFALRGLPDAVAGRPPVAGVTLLEAAFSHFAFGDVATANPIRPGALKGQDAKVRGPVVACYSRYDGAVGTFYPLASLAAGEDSAGLVDDRFYRWGGLGHDGHQRGVKELALASPGHAYDFGGSSLVNIDAASVVKHGSPPSGAHSDIVHDELAWVVLSAGGLTR